MKATADTADPVPGFLYDEINAMSHESTVVSCQLVDFFVERLGKDSRHVKLKTLKLMKHLVHHGNADFRTELRDKSQRIQAACDYSSQLDANRDTSEDLVIRTTAKELLEIMFDVEAEDIRSPHQPVVTSKCSSSVSGMGSSAGHRGFGNTTITEKSVGEKILSTLGDLTNKLSRSVAVTPTQQTHAHQGFYRPSPPQSTVAPLHNTSMQPSTAHQRDYQRGRGGPGVSHNSLSRWYYQTVAGTHIPGRAGGGWEDDDTSIHGNNTGSTSSDGVDSSKSDGLLKDVDWSEEQGVVTDCLSKDSTALLTRYEIREFISSPYQRIYTEKCYGCNCDKILELLNVELIKDLTSQTHTTRVLQLIEQLMNTDLLSLDSLVDCCQGNLMLIHSSNTGQSMFKAKKILLSLERLTGRTDLIPSPVKAGPATATRWEINETTSLRGGTSIASKNLADLDNSASVINVVAESRDGTTAEIGEMSTRDRVQRSSHAVEMSTRDLVE